MEKYKVITLCGSIRFKEDFLREQARLTLEGNIVLSAVFFDYYDKEIILDCKTKSMMAKMHKQKIDMSDEIFVINKNGYIGASTQEEIEYALKNGKKVNYMEK